MRCATLCFVLCCCVCVLTGPVIESAAFNATFGSLRSEHSAWYAEHLQKGEQQLAEHAKRLAQSGGEEAEQTECEQFVKWCGNSQDVKNVCDAMG